MISHVILIVICLVYAVLNVSGAALIKIELPYHHLSSIKDYLLFLLTWRVICGFGIILLSALIMFKALSLGKFSYVIPIATGINFSLTVILGVFLFNDKLSCSSYIGLMLILSGIIVMSLKTV